VEVVVVGGGAAGFFGAIACAAAHPATRVHLLEAGRHPLAKVRISGGGRCNVTHHCFDPALLVQHYPRGGKALRGPFSRFQPQDTVAWFQQRGVALKTEADGRMFPVSDDSGTIIDCLLREAQRLGVILHTQTLVQHIHRADQGFELTLKSRRSQHPQGQSPPPRCDRILLATGSSPQGHRLARTLGHTIIPPVPSLFSFNIAEAALQALAGVAIDPVTLTLALSQGKPLIQSGPLLITHWGLSGPAVLKLSAWGARPLHEQRYQADLFIHWLPSRSAEQLRLQFLATKQHQARKPVCNYSPTALPRRLWQYLVARAQISPDTTWANLSKKSLHQLLQELTHGHYPISGKGSFKEEFVTCGGVALNDVNFKTLESRRCPGLYFAGELLDIDGITGGFNFQSAWTTGWLAGQAMGQQT